MRIEAKERLEAMKILKEVMLRIIEHAKRDAPLEACGYLAGKDAVITAHYELTNIDKSCEHFFFDPKEQFAAIRDARAQRLAILAVYHSHPHTPAWPSEEDIRLANDPDLRYMIVSLAESTAAVKSFKIRHKEVIEEEVEVI